MLPYYITTIDEVLKICYIIVYLLNTWVSYKKNNGNLNGYSKNILYLNKLNFSEENLLET